MDRTDKLVRNTFKGILAVNIVSMVSAIAAVMVDAIVTGQFLGIDAVASVGLIQPVVMFCNLIGTMFGPGLSIVCTRYMGMAKPDRVVKSFSLVMVTMGIIAATVAVLMFALAPVIAVQLGAKTNDPDIVAMISDYLRGYSFGMPFLVFSMSIAGLMMLDNDKKRSVLSVLVTLIADIVFDLLNVLVFHGGMLGMAVATSVSTILGFVVLLTHFLKKERILHFRLSGLRISDLKEIMLSSVPNAITTGSGAIRNLVFNALLLAIATKIEVSALSVTNSAFTIIIAVTLASNLSASTISSLFYGEEDRRGIETSFKSSVKYNLAIFSGITAVLMVFASETAKLFLNSGDMSELNTAVFFIRCMILEYLLMSVSYSFTGVYQGTRHLTLNYLLVILRELGFPVVCVLILGRLFGVRGVGAGFITAGALSIITCLMMPVILKRKLPKKTGDFILLDDDFGSKPEDTFEASVHNMGEVTQASTAVMEFYKQHEMDDRTSMFVSLFLEEMLSNIIEHGYTDERNKNADIRVICNKSEQVIRIRDDGKPFDPLEWYRMNHPEDPASGLGIRMVVALTKDVRYVPAMGLNNLMLIL